MNKLNKLFRNKQEDILSVYFTAGFPKLDDTKIIIRELENAGVDMIEIGMPFSDPLADGPTIQRSSEKALENGMSIKLLFEQLSDQSLVSIKASCLLMGYLNPVLQYGLEKFCKDAAWLGISGVIIPDLPLQEYVDEYKTIFEKYDLATIFLITPQTSEARIRFIDEHSNSFIYVVSSSSTTGATSSDEEKIAQEKYFKRIQSMQLKNPLLIGFGISDQQSFANACNYASGAIIGSAFIKELDHSIDLKKSISSFVNRIKNKP
ncbi:MAG: tryptophan synthase alpha chain [Bacteroidetes bacterium]|nr:tryptophan synthase alpha chain [Bacteroidota bacterium]